VGGAKKNPELSLDMMFAYSEKYLKSQI